MQNTMSRIAARIRGCAPYFRRVTPPKTNPAIAQSFNAAQVKLVLQLDQLHHDEPAQAATVLESWVGAGVFSAAQQSVITSLLRLEHDDLLRTLLDCAATNEARRVVGEELLRLSRQ
jgi:BioD-like phosphotransacetylase family protein